MPQESSPAPRPRYQQPEPWQPQPPAQAYSQRPPAGQVPPYQGHQYQGAQYQGQQPHGGQGQTPPRPDQAYGQQQQQQYRAPLQQSADRQPEYPVAQYSQPEPPVQAYSEGPAQAYSERPHPGQSSPQQQRYGSERYADPRFQPPAHLYPPQQPTEGPPPPPQQPPPQQPGQSVPHGYQDQAYADQAYPLQDPSAAGGEYADPHYSTQGGTPQQRPWTADGPGVSLELGDGSGRNLELRRGSNILGRGQDADFRIPDTGVSRQHADIQWDGAVALVVDLQSTNGTVVNNIPISEWQLADGDVIRMGHSDITVRFH